MLFTGDAGAQSEARMLANSADLAADVRLWSINCGLASIFNEHNHQFGDQNRGS